MHSKYVIFIAISALFAGSIYGSSIPIGFAADCEYSHDGKSAICSVNTGLPDQRTYYCSNDNGKWNCKPAEARSNPPRDLSDAISKAQSAESIKPDLKGSKLLKGGELLKGGQTTVSNDTGSNTKGKLNFGESSPLIDRNKSPLSTSEQPSSGSGAIAKYTCEGLKCTCHGDVDCNDMFTADVCGDVASCDTGADSCSCLKKAG
jgi:hypothetical protein